LPQNVVCVRWYVGEPLFFARSIGASEASLAPSAPASGEGGDELLDDEHATKRAATPHVKEDRAKKVSARLIDCSP
jgi:hypothetical protein